VLCVDSAISAADRAKVGATANSRRPQSCATQK